MTARVGDGDAFADAIARLRARMAAPLPGRDRRMDPAPEQRPSPDPGRALAGGTRAGGALVLVYPIDGQPHTALTLRRADLRLHAGQVSLPGGRVERGETPRAAALREAWEELAIDPDRVEVLGSLTPVYIPPTDFLLFPTLAVAKCRPDFILQPSEVAELIEVPVVHLFDERHRRVELWDLRGESRRVPFFAIDRHKVWGATAMVLGELATVWQESLRVPDETAVWRMA